MTIEPIHLKDTEYSTNVPYLFAHLFVFARLNVKKESQLTPSFLTFTL
jgi:hypothetical protein